MQSLPVNDRLLRAAAEHQLRLAEQKIEAAATKAIRGWLKMCRDLIVHEASQLTAAAWPAARAVDAANASWQVWRTSLDQHVVPAVALVMGEAFQQQRRLTPGSSFLPQQDYLAAVRDRLVIWPEGAFEELRPELLEALADADTIEDITDRIGRILNIDATTRDLRARISEIDAKLDDPDLQPERRAELRARRRSLWNAHDQSQNEWRWKARRIARTEAHGAVQHGQYEAAVQAQQMTGETYYRRWLATEDTRTRPTHRLADGQIVKLGERFQVGAARLMYPGDVSVNAPSETINCRCSSVILPWYQAQRELQGQQGSLGEVRPEGRRLGPDDPTVVAQAADDLKNRPETGNAAVPDVAPLDVPDDLEAVSDDELVELLIAADHAGDDALWDRIDAEFDRRALEDDDDLTAAGRRRVRNVPYWSLRLGRTAVYGELLDGLEQRTPRRRGAHRDRVRDIVPPSEKRANARKPAHPHGLRRWSEAKRAAEQAWVLPNYPGEPLVQHEIEFARRFKRKHHFTWIPRPEPVSVTWSPRKQRKPSHDLIWHNNGGIVVEVKSVKPQKSSIANAIRSAVSTARSNRVEQVTKENFIIDLGPHVLTSRLAWQIGAYNQDQEPQNRIRRLWVLHSDGQHLEAIVLRK